MSTAVGPVLFWAKKQNTYFILLFYSILVRKKGNKSTENSIIFMDTKYLCTFFIPDYNLS